MAKQREQPPMKGECTSLRRISFAEAENDSELRYMARGQLEYWDWLITGVVGDRDVQLVGGEE